LTAIPFLSDGLMGPNQNPGLTAATVQKNRAVGRANVGRNHLEAEAVWLYRLRSLRQGSQSRGASERDSE
jgi:hypothetical protein